MDAQIDKTFAFLLFGDDQVITAKNGDNEVLRKMKETS